MVQQVRRGQNASRVLDDVAWNLAASVFKRNTSRHCFQVSHANMLWFGVFCIRTERSPFTGICKCRTCRNLRCVSRYCACYLFVFASSDVAFVPRLIICPFYFCFVDDHVHIDLCVILTRLWPEARRFDHSTQASPMYMYCMHNM